MFDMAKLDKIINTTFIHVIIVVGHHDHLDKHGHSSW